MLSNQIHRALAQGYNRFEVCRITAKGVRVMHKPGARFEETIGMALTEMGEVRNAPKAGSRNLPPIAGDSSAE